MTLSESFNKEDWLRLWLTCVGRMPKARPPREPTSTSQYGFHARTFYTVKESYHSTEVISGNGGGGHSRIVPSSDWYKRFADESDSN